MKKSLIIVLLATILLTSCGKSIGDEAVQSGKIAIENKQYQKAEAYFEIALEKGIQEEEISVLRENITSYINVIEKIEDDKINEAIEIINEIEPSYKEYALKKEIDELKEKIMSIQEKRELIYSKYQRQIKEIEHEDENSEELKKLRMGNMLDMKKAASMSYTMWDKALNDIYKEMRKQIPENIMTMIQKEQIAWISYKELQAKADSYEFFGGSMEGLAYMISLGDTTKIRCYELLEYLKMD